jgi:hypothetical protein
MSSPWEATMRTALVLLGIAACSGSDHTTNVKPTLRLADQDDTTIARLISAAGGTDMFSAEAQVDRFSTGGDPCPGVAVSGNAISLTGGCTTTDGVTIDGAATITNPTAWDQVLYNYQQDTTYDFTGMALTQQGYSQSMDGSIRITDNFQVQEADLTVDMLGAALRSDIYIKCERTGQTSVSCALEGSGLELVGVGGVTASGTIDESTTGQSASFTLHGLDTLTATIASGCVAWQIDGTDRAKVCQ